MGIIELVFAAIIGASFGSFANVLIYRTPLGISIIKPGSFCFACKNKIKPIHNIPILSFILLKGKCAYCGKKISFLYPIVEFLSALLFVAVFLKNGFLVSSFLVSIVFVLFLALSVIDIHHQEVADSINLSALSIAFIHAAPNYLEIVDSFKNGLLLAGGFTLLRFYLSYILKKEAMGEGDIIIAATIGSLLGIKLSLLAIFLAALLALPIALVLKKKTERIPFIPFLSLGTFISYFVGNEIVRFLGI